MNESVAKVIGEVKKVILGKDEVIEKVLMAILAQGHVLLDDVPGTGKTTMSLSFAKTLGLEFKRVQFTSDTMPSDIIGFSVYDRDAARLSYKPGAIMTNFLLADEINRTSAKTQSALLEAMEEGHVTVDGTTHDLPDPFFVMATQNPAGSAGTQLLPNSQLDRFIVRLSMGYPELQSQADILKARHATNPLDKVTPQVSPDELRGMIEATSQVYIADELYTYMASLAEETRHEENLDLGVSPRGTLALMRMSQAHAYVRGRDFVAPVDILEVLPGVFAHRLILNAKARLNEVSAEDIVAQVAQRVPIPQRVGTGNPQD